MTTNDAPLTPFTAEEFAGLGDGSVAYVRSFQTEELRKLFPQAPELPAGQRVFALINADGTPIMLSDSRDVALADAMEKELHTVSLH